MNEYQPKNMLITGGAGFIGSNFIRYILSVNKQINIINLDKLTYAGDLNNLKNLPDDSRYTFVHGDICDSSLLDSIFQHRHIDTILHFAAESHVDRSITGPAQFVQTNITGTFTLLETARKYWIKDRADAEDCRFHHISTDEVYGSLKKKDPPFTETTQFAPNSPYSASKAGSDHFVRSYLHTYGLPMTITNCSNNYGPYQNQEKFIPTIIAACLNQQQIPVYGDGSNIRDWLYVTDHCSGIETVIQKGTVGETYNIGGGFERANIDIARIICKQMDKIKPENKPHENLITYVQDRPGHDWRYAIDAGKIEKELGWRPVETFETGIEKTIQWYVRNGDEIRR